MDAICGCPSRFSWNPRPGFDFGGTLLEHFGTSGHR